MSTDSVDSLKLPRKLGAFTATAVVVANMVGAGIFTSSGIMAAQLPGPGWILTCWLAGGLIAMSGALCYAELATRMPEGGGEYVYLKRLYHPMLGFLTGWTSFFVGFSAPTAGAALAITAYMHTAFETALPGTGLSALILAKKIPAVLIIVVFTGLHYFGCKFGAKVQNFLTVIKILIILGLAFTGVSYGSGSWANLSYSSGEPFSIFAIGTVMMMIMFSYSGWNASSYIASEIKNPGRSLPVSLISGTAIVIILYMIINIFIFYSAPYTELKGTIAVAEAAAVRAFGSGMADILSGMIGIILLSSLGAFIMIGPRVYHAMAKDGLFFKFANKIHHRYGVPGRSILIQGLMAVIMVLAGTFEQLLIYVGFALCIFPWLAVAGLFIARKEKIGEETAVNVRGYPYVPLFFLTSSLSLMVIAFINRPMESTAAIITVFLGIPCYYLWVRRIKFPEKIVPFQLQPVRIEKKNYRE